MLPNTKQDIMDISNGHQNRYLKFKLSGRADPGRGGEGALPIYK